MAYNFMDSEKMATNKRINRIIDLLKHDYTKHQATIINLQKIKDGTQEPKIKPLALYLDVLEKITAERDNAGYIAKLISYADELYDEIFVFGEETPDFERNAEIFKLLTGSDGLVMKGYYNRFLFASFTYKNNYLTLVRLISTQPHSLDLFDNFVPFALEVREYIPEEQTYLAFLLKTVSKMVKAGPDGYDSVIKEETTHLQRINGYYDIDPVRLAQVEKNVSTAEFIVDSGKNVLNSLDRKSKDLDRFFTDLDEKAKAIVQAAGSSLDMKARNAQELLDDELKEYVNVKKQTIDLDRDLFVKEALADIQSEMEKYKSMAQSITACAAAEVASIGKDADQMINRLKDSTLNEAKLGAFIERSKEDQVLLERIEKLTILNDNMIDRFGKNMETSKEATVNEELVAAAAAPMPAPPFPNPAPERRRFNDRPIPPVNFMLDRNAPFQDRFAAVMKEKERRMERGEIFHEMFDDVVTAVLEDANPYLIGPSGCGKTFMVQQIGEMLNVDISDIGYINEEYDILGYVTAMGDYSQSNFYWLYKYGGIAFCDELDNGNSKATVKLNSFMSNNINASYSFPGGERVAKHPNFRIIAAGNTDGTGADLNYSTRERIEESVLQRMVPIYIDYDNRVEQEILINYPEWYEFAVAFRQATNHWSNVCGIPAQGIFTTRDAFRTKQYLDDSSYTTEKILLYQFIQTKEAEYLGFLKEDMLKSLPMNSPGYEIFTMFVNLVDNIRQKGMR